MAAAVSHPIFARLYARLTRMEGREEREQRALLLAGAAGRVVEVGAGSGANFPHYGAEVSEVVAVEPEAFLRREAERAARQAPVPVRVLDGTAEALPLADGEADVVVCSLVLCSVPDPAAALREAARVLRPGGELRFLEHVAASGGAHARVQRALDATLWPRLFGNCHTHRSTAAAIARAGFGVEEEVPLRIMPSPCAWPVSTQVRGVARKD